MSRRSFIAAIGIVALLAAVVAGCLLVLIRYEPQYYNAAPLPQGDQGRDCAKNFLVEASNMSNSIANDHEWGAQFTDEQINSVLNESYVQSTMAGRLLPDGVSDPRVVFEEDRVRLAFRLRQSFLSTVISMDMRVWLARNEPNVVAVRLESFRAGVLPIGAHWLLEQISESGRQNGIDVNWYRHEGYPVALLRFQADQARPTIQIQRVKVEKGSITIQGKSNDNVRVDLRLPEKLLELHAN